MFFRVYMLQFRVNSLVFYTGLEFPNLHNQIMTIVHLDKDTIRLSYDGNNFLTINNYDINEFNHATADDILKAAKDPVEDMPVEVETVNTVDVYKEIKESSNDLENVIRSSDIINVIDKGYADIAFKSLKNFIISMKTKDGSSNDSRKLIYRYNKILKEMDRLSELYNIGQESDEDKSSN